MPQSRPQPDQQVNAPIMMRAAETRPASYREEDNSIEIVWTTGARVLRFDWWDDEYYFEELSLDDGAVRLERLNAGAPLLDSHISRGLASVIGSVVPGSASVGNGEGTARVRLASTPDVADSVAKIRDGIVRNVSVGYSVHSFTRIENEGERPIMRATDWEPMELSFVAIPADAGAQSRSADPAQGGNPCIIRGAAATRKEHEMPEPTPSVAPAPAPTPALAAAPAAEPTLQPQRAEGISATRIRSICSRSDVGDSFALDLIARNEATPMSEADLTDAIATQLESTRARPALRIEVGATGTEEESYQRAIGDAMLVRSDPMFNLTPEQASAAREFRGLTLMELARDYLERSGISARGMGRLELAGAALGFRNGAMVTSDFANALSSAVNRRVRSAYEAAPQTFAPIVSRGTLPDFKPASIVGLGDAPQLQLVLENAEFTYGALSDTGMSYALKTYGKIIAITRQAIINDDKSLFSRIPTQFGRKAADLESDLVWGMLTSNPVMADSIALFHASHGNLAGSGSAISLSALAAAEQAMLTQTSPEGNYISGNRPAYLIVGPAKKVEAQQALAAVVANDTQKVNIFAGALQLIVEPRITGNQWYLSADPAAFDTIELSHLDGQEGLYLETQNGFDIDGVKTKARLDVGAAVIDHRGFYKNPGA